MYVRANDDLICIDKLIKAEFNPAPYNNNSSIKLTYLVNDIDTKESFVTSEFSNISKNCIELLVNAIKTDKNFVDLSKNT